MPLGIKKKLLNADLLRMRIALLRGLLAALVAAPCSAHAQDLTPRTYDIGAPLLQEIYVDPIAGSDDHSGASRAQALRTVDAAWRSIPAEATLSTGYRINLLPGTYAAEDLPNYWELRRGTAEHPIILAPLDGRDTVRWNGGVNMANCSYVYFIDVRMLPNPPADVFHCELCDHILLRGNRMDGAVLGYGNGEETAHETVKFNQSQYVYIENNNLSGAGDNVIDFVAVQYGHVVGNRIHQGGDWCMYAKGGSAYLRVEGNEIYDCGTGGFTAGQGTGLQFMTSPWIHYEAYDLKIVNNVIHDTDGAALGVNGGYNILFAHNTAYRIGARSHLFEAVFGARSCDPGDGELNCATLVSSGAWGPNSVAESGDEGAPVGNRNVFLLNNIFYNPAGTQSGSQHFAVYGPRSPAAGTNLDDPQHSDVNLVIKGNLIWNGDSGMPLGVEESDQGCQNANPTCNAAQLTAENTINTLEPELAAPGSDDFRPAAGSNVLTAATYSLASFLGGDRVSTPLAPQGTLSNSLDRDYSATTRSGAQPPGAFISIDSDLNAPGESNLPDDGSSAIAPTVSRLTAVLTRKGRVVTVKVTVRADNDPTSVMAVLSVRNNTAAAGMTLKRGKYAGKVRMRAKQRKFKLAVTAVNAAGSASKRTTIKG